jgi:acyl carrier protein
MAPDDDPVAAYLRELWREMLRIERVDPDLTFHALGGDSLLMVHMLVAVTANFDCEIDYEDFLEAPSLTRLARLVRDALAANRGPRHLR